MALGNPHKIVEDDPSEVVRLSRKELNKLLDAFSALVDASQLATFAAFQTAVAAIDMTALRKVLMTFERPPAPESRLTP